MKEIREIYLGRKGTFEKELSVLLQREKGIIWLRTLAGLAFLGLLIYGWAAGIQAGVYGSLGFLVFFLVLVGRHERLKGKIQFHESLVTINEMGMHRLDGSWKDFSRKGEEFLDLTHPYARDLSLFGPGSLFQYLNVGATSRGEETLARWLAAGVTTEEIPAHQEAVRDLTSRLDWRQRFQAAGMGKMDRFTPKALQAWAVSPSLWEAHPWLGWVWWLPLGTLTLYLIHYFVGIAPWFMAAVVTAQLVISVLGGRIGRQAFEDTMAAVAALERYAALLELAEGEKFSAPYLRKLTKDIHGKGEPVSRRMKGLARIANRITYRYSPLIHFVLDWFTLWDIQTLRRLENWKKASGPLLDSWLEAVAQLEALSGLAGLAYDNPRWAFPDVGGDGPVLVGTALGHPLIGAGERVTNDVSLARPGDVLIITGSNMSGKSTFLRTVGVNLVLAYCGAPICGKALTCAPLVLYTAMQVEDSLQEHTSAFFAELKRLKLLVDGAKRGENVVFLLDEFFKGTNSGDRITGARLLIRRLHGLGAVGLVTTHDLEVSRLEEEYSGYIRNYHFTDTLRAERIDFDYKLKPGVCRKTNAIALMKHIGIDV